MADIPTTYTYKVYNGAEYLGMLEDVISEPSYTQAINTAGSAVKIELAASFPDVDAETVVTNLVDGAGNQIVDEAGNNIIVERVYEFNNVPITLGNRIVITEYSNYNPNGVTYFDGFIFDWDGGYKSDKLVITLMSHGARLNNYIVNPDEDVSVTQSDYDTEVAIASGIKDAGDAYAQTFQVATDIAISSIGIYMRKDGSGIATVSMNLYEGTPSSPGSLLGSVLLNDLSGTTAALNTFAFSTPIDLTASTNYHWLIRNLSGETSFYSTPYLQYENSSVYANGQLYQSIAGAAFSGMTADAAFTLNSTTGSVEASFNNIDPSDITRTALNVFNNKGGLVTYDDNSIDDTGLSVNYTFLLATALETAAKGYDLSPSSWYWFVDVATNLYHMHDTSQTADHTLTLGRHLDDLNISQTLATVKNIVYFSGGDTGSGENLFRINSDQSSINSYGQWLERVSDNRITESDTADLYSLARLGKYSVPPFNVSCVIPASKYDISTLQLGQMVKLNNFNNLIDSLLNQIIELDRHADFVELKLGIPQVRNSKLIDDMQRRLLALETVNNPDIET